MTRGNPLSEQWPQHARVVLLAVTWRWRDKSRQTMSAQTNTDRRLFAALRAQALAPRQAQIRRIWRVGACDHLCTATVVTLVFLTGIDGAGDRSRRPDHPRRLVAAVPVGLGSPPQVSGGVIPGGLSQLLGSGCPGGLPPAARNRAPPPPGAKSPRDHAGQPGGNRSRLAGCS